MDESALGVDAEDGGVVGGGCADEEAWVGDGGEALEDGGEGLLGEFGGAAGAGGHGGEADGRVGHVGKGQLGGWSARGVRSCAWQEARDDQDGGVKKLLALCNFSFLPCNGPMALLLLRVWVGLSMLLLHGWPKALLFGERAQSFPDPLGIGGQASHALAVFGEAFCSVLLVLGVLTRFSAMAGIVTMGVAFFMQKKGALSGAASGELAYVYLACYVVVFVAGPGRFSLDQRLGGGKGGKS